MPVYEYRCPKCGNRSEVIKPMTQADRPEYCRDFCGEEIARVFTPAVIHMGGVNVNGHRYSVGDVQALADGTY